MSFSIVSILKRLVPGGPIYVQIRSNMLQLRDVSTGKQVSIEPVLVVPQDGTVDSSWLSSSQQFSTEGPVKRLNGFDHPRTIIFDFVVAERTLRLALAELFEERFFRPSPVLVLHPMERIEGGLTWIEHRALQELGEGAGARRVHIWEGRTLTDNEVQNPDTFSKSNVTGA